MIQLLRGCVAAARFARLLSREELEVVGAWVSRETGLRGPVPGSTLHRVVRSVDPEALEDVVRRYARTRIPLARAIAADGKRIRGADGDGHHGTVALTGHASGAPFALPDLDGGGGELAATRDLPERTDVRGKVVTFDALHTTRGTARPVTRHCGADHVLNVRGTAPETFAAPVGIYRERDATGRFAEDPDRAHGRIEWRSVDVMTPLPRMASHPGVSQIARVTRHRETVKTGEASTGTAYLITSLDADRASPERLPALDRGHWCVENMNHRQRDCAFGGDACQTRTGNGPANRPGPNNLALAVILTGRTGGESLADTRRRRLLDRAAAIQALTAA